MKSLSKYLKEALDLENANHSVTQVIRNQELSNITPNHSFSRYAIQVVFVTDDNLLMEHELYRKFKKTNSYYRKDPADASIPVQAHYHIMTSKGKQEIYAVNMDGTAQHRVNKRYEVPKKEADELRKLGVTIPANCIIESIERTIYESLDDKRVSITLFIEGDAIN